MSVIRVISVVGLLVMAFAIVMAVVTGDFFAEGSAIWAAPWGKVTLIDLYVGLAFFAAWVWFRESSPPRVLAWWLVLAVLGNLAAAMYLTLAAFSSRSVAELITGDSR